MIQPAGHDRIDPEALSCIAAAYTREMTSIRGRRVQRLLKREFAGAEYVLTVQVGSERTAVLGLSDCGAAWCVTDGRGPSASVVKWQHGCTQALEERFDLLKDSLPLLAAESVALASVGGQTPIRVAAGSAAPRVRALMAKALEALA